MNFDAYKNALPYPRKGDFQTTYWYKQGRCVCTQKPGESLAPGFDAKSCVKEVVADEDAYRAARDAYHAEERRLTEQFKADLLHDLDMANHPLADKFYAKAWEMGHANGLGEVYNCAHNLSDLFDCPPELMAAVQIMDKFEYNSDGGLRRYPDEAEYNKAMKVLKGL